MAASSKARLAHAAVVVSLADAHGFRKSLDAGVGIAIKAYCDQLLATEEAMDDDDVEGDALSRSAPGAVQRPAGRRWRRLVNGLARFGDS